MYYRYRTIITTTTILLPIGYTSPWNRDLYYWNIPESYLQMYCAVLLGKLAISIAELFLYVLPVQIQEKCTNWDENNLTVFCICECAIFRKCPMTVLWGANPMTVLWGASHMTVLWVLVLWWFYGIPHSTMVLWGTTPYDGYMGSPLYYSINSLYCNTRQRTST